eukprot:CAMPEP_0197866808 /NCGR_PEP_ID=MMETSP1438-20131217/44412_1 /TAXON_ID=1461541 /ORGANISM="Pterosperma sp., Strain CCMP1384" /LENGTH=337 /DNA_ID=CAMNT_0043485403 /DNA_START=787 /DNA_END=1800 /DNA_ORIENTATION=+
MVSKAAARYPRYMQEINGTAAGAGQDLDLMLVANMKQELATALTPPGADEAGVLLGDACTDVFVKDPQNKVTSFAHNEDFFSYYFDLLYVVRMNVENRGSFTAVTYPGILPGWSAGWNNHHLAFSINVLYPSAMLPNGVTTVFVGRDLYEAQDLEDAIRRAAPLDLMGGQNVNIGSFIEQRIVTIETAPGGVKSVYEMGPSHGGNATYFHANEYLRLQSIPQFEKSIISSQHRRSAYEHVRPPPVTLRGLLSVLGDTSDPSYPVFRRNDATKESTLYTIAFDLRQGQIQIYRNNPREGAASLLWSETVLMPQQPPPPPGRDSLMLRGQKSEQMRLNE